MSLSSYSPEYQAGPGKVSPWATMWALSSVVSACVMLGMNLAPAVAPTLLAVAPQVTTTTRPVPVSAAVHSTFPHPGMGMKTAAPPASGPARQWFPAVQNSGEAPVFNLPTVDASSIPMFVLGAIGTVAALLGLASSKKSTNRWAMAATSSSKPLLDSEGDESSNSISAAVISSRPVVAGDVSVDVPVVPEVDAPPLESLVAWTLAITAAFGGGLAVAYGSTIAVQGVAGVIALYVIMSINEYVVHRYYQHLGWNTSPVFMLLKKGFPSLPRMKSSGHVEHHRETLDDMTLDVRNHHILDDDPYRGTAFSWSVTAAMTIEIALQSYPVLYLLGWSFQWSTIGLAVGVGFHGLVWQALHPAMHGLPDPPAVYGFPGRALKMFRDSPYFRFLYVNHVGHHRVPGAMANYNVCYPLADHLFGTYVGTVPPAKKVEA